MEGQLALIAIAADKPPDEPPAENEMAIVVTLFAGTECRRCRRRIIA